MRLVDDYIEALPDDRKELTAMIREMIVENVPSAEERFSFRLPFYHYFGMFMYLHNDPEGVHVAFCRGKDLIDQFPQLQLKNRAAIATVCITKKSDIRDLEVRELILTAAAWNQEAKSLKIPMVRKKKK